jgi:hypothetical protein
MAILSPQPIPRWFLLAMARIGMNFRGRAIDMTSSHNEELFLAIGRLEGKVDSLLAMQGQQQDQIKAHDGRIRLLENARHHLMGYAAAIGAGVSILVNYLAKSIH